MKVKIVVENVQVKLFNDKDEEVFGCNVDSYMINTDITNLASTVYALVLAARKMDREAGRQDELHKFKLDPATQATINKFYDGQA